MEGAEDGQFDEAYDVTYVELLRYNALFVIRKQTCMNMVVLSPFQFHVAVLKCS